jgi:NAD(P)-dependent dehydrogenase (short-subunit alcohol dehydrogenase family)
MKEFEGKKVMITGASQGIGRSTAVKFAENGAKVYINYSRNDEAAKDTLKQVEKAGGKGEIVKADMGNEGEVKAMWAQVMKDGKPLSALILNAAYQKKALLIETELDLIRRTMEVNVIGNFHLAKLYAESCIAAKIPGVIVVHSSNQAEFVNPTGFAYALSKAALNHMVRHLAGAYVKNNIRVNGVILGWFDTDGERKFYSKEQIAQQAAQTVPMGRAGYPEEAAEFAYFLTSDKSTYFTGSMLRCDGGFAIDPDLGT